MSKQIIELPVENLRIGLYVSRLDRPWEGTPFLFQGFEVESDEELITLRSLCKHVSVEVTADEADALNALQKLPREAPVQERVINLLDQMSTRVGAFTSTVPTTDPASLKTELKVATEAFAEAKRAVKDAFERLRKGGGFDATQVGSVVDTMVDSIFRNRDAMCWLARMKTKDDYLYSHSLAAPIWALAFGRHLGLDKETLKIVGTGAMLLDVGKTQLSSDLLRKEGKPTPDEWKQLRGHVEAGVKLVSANPSVDPRVVSMLQTHHERHDGSGYPRKLKGEEIPMIGRIAGIVDTYDAMISARSYARPKSAYDAVRALKTLGGVGFADDLVELFIQAVGVFPTGTLVELNTGEVAVVVAQNRFRRLRPEIMLILDPAKAPLAEFTTIDLMTCPENSEASDPKLWITRGLECGAHGIDPTEYFL